MSSRFDSAIAAFKILLRDVVGPLFGLWLVLQLGRGKFDTAAIPVIATLASALIGIPFWSRSDERDRAKRSESRRKKRVTIDREGIKWGGDGQDDGDEKAP